MKLLKILQIHNHYREAGGEDTVVRREQELLKAAGHEVIEFRTENPSRTAAAVATLATSAWNPVSARRMREAILQRRPDVAHVHNTWWMLSPSILRPLVDAGVPVVLTLHNYRLLCANAMLYREGQPCEECVGIHPWRAVRYRCYRGSFLASAAAVSAIEVPRRLGVWHDVAVFLTLTHFARQRFIAGGLPAERLVVKPNFVDDPGGRMNPSSASNTVLFVGRLSEEKGIRNLLDVWRDGPTDLELLVVGDGPLGDELRATAPPGVRFAGRVQQGQVSELMRRARAMVFPSVWYEGQPMVLLEALAAGLPLLVSSIGGIPETVGDRGAAISVAPDDRSAWGEALSRLADGAWVDEASLQARATYEARYSVEPALDGLTRAYEIAIRGS